jgi:hypothetical protein
MPLPVMLSCGSRRPNSSAGSRVCSTAFRRHCLRSKWLLVRSSSRCDGPYRPAPCHRRHPKVAARAAGGCTSKRSVSGRLPEAQPWPRGPVPAPNAYVSHHSRRNDPKSGAERVRLSSQPSKRPRAEVQFRNRSVGYPCLADNRAAVSGAGISASPPERREPA